MRHIPTIDRAPAAVVRRNALERDKRRAAELLDAHHFLVEGHDAHLARPCLFDEPCSRDYDPGPRPENEHDYVGTGIGALFGLPAAPALYGELAGWNVRRAA